jgi:hypothetical protein
VNGVAAQPARADDDPLNPAGPHATTPEPPVDRNKKPPADDDAETPDEPIVKANAGILAWPYLRTSIQMGRHRVSGPPIQDAEDTVGLPDRAISPWLEASFGTTIRVGFSVLDLDRLGTFTKVAAPLEVAGISVATNDYAQVGVHYTQGEAFAQWDALVGPRYRFGVLGGGRLIRFGTYFRSVSIADGIHVDSRGTNQYVFSPMLGGTFEVDPASFFTVYASIRFIDWAWEAINLHDQRTFDFRVGGQAMIYEDLVGLGLEFRYLSVFVDPARFNGGTTNARIDLDGAAVVMTAVFRY